MQILPEKLTRKNIIIGIVATLVLTTGFIFLAINLNEKQPQDVTKTTQESVVSDTPKILQLVPDDLKDGSTCNYFSVNKGEVVQCAFSFKRQLSWVDVQNINFQIIIPTTVGSAEKVPLSAICNIDGNDTSRLVCKVDTSELDKGVFSTNLLVSGISLPNVTEKIIVE